MPGFATCPLCPISVHGTQTLAASVTPCGDSPPWWSPHTHTHTPSPPSLTFFPKVHTYISDLLLDLSNPKTSLHGFSTDSSVPVHSPLKWSSPMSSLFTPLSGPGEKPPPLETGTCLPQTEGLCPPSCPPPLDLNTTTALVLDHSYQWACSSLH